MTVDSARTTQDARQGLADMLVSLAGKTRAEAWRQAWRVYPAAEVVPGQPCASAFAGTGSDG